MSADELKTFMTQDATLLLKNDRERHPSKKHVAVMKSIIEKYKHDKEKAEDLKKFNDHLLSLGEVFDDLCDQSEEMGKTAEALFKDKPELVTCKSMTQVLLALHAYAKGGMNVWLIVGIVGGVVGGLLIIGLLVYFFWWRPKKAAL